MRALPEEILVSGDQTDQPHTDQRPTDRLDSWKEIAAYFRRDVRTVRRWEQSLGLPVHRHRQTRGVGVYAYKREVDEWWKQRDEAAVEFRVSLPQTRRSIGPLGWVVVALLATFGLLQSGVWRATPLEPSPGSGTASVSPGGYPGVEEYPSLSPDALQMAFSWKGPDRRNFDIYIKALDRRLRDAIRLTSDPAADFNPTWSPDGRSIAFVRQIAEHEFEVMLIPAAGGAERSVATCQAEWDRRAGAYLAWTPDGRGLMVLQRWSQRQAAGLVLLPPGNRPAQRFVLPLEGARASEMEPAASPVPCVVMG
jgi:hypothetical protein